MRYGSASGRWRLRTDFSLGDVVMRAPRVLVTDAEQRAALSTCRALKTAGYEVAAAATRRLAVGFWSRSCVERLSLPDPRDDGRAYVERLAQEVRQRRYDVLVAGSEASLIPISEYRELIDHDVRLGLPPHDIVLRSLDKRRLISYAEAAGLSPPPTRVCASLSAALAAVAELGYPVVVKPERSFVERAGRLQQGEVAVAVDEAGLVRAVTRAGTPLVIQKYILSPQILFCGAVHADQSLLGLTFGRIERTWPPDAGSASMAVTIDPPQGIEAKVYDFVSHIGWEGIFQLQFLDLGDGRFGLIDLNPRIFASIVLPVRAGANLPALWCDHLLARKSLTSRRPRAGVYYRCEDAELRYAVRQVLSGELRRGLSLLRLHRPTAYPYFELRDPAPLLARFLELGVNAYRKRRRP